MHGRAPMRFLILGAGFTGSRVARRLLELGHDVTATTRRGAKLAHLAEAGADVREFVWDSEGGEPIPEPPPGERWRVLLSVPSVQHGEVLADPTASLAAAAAPHAERLVYLSTTGVYGPAYLVDETTPVQPITERQELRVAAEGAVLSAAVPSLVLRPAAIYGPHRGVHQALREGRFPLVNGGHNYTSRIHVDDLARITTAALLSDVTGAFPVADDCPSTSLEIVEFCCGLLGLALPSSAPASGVSETRRADRRVDGRAIRKLLGVQLAYSGFREGIPACLAAELRDSSTPPVKHP